MPSRKANFGRVGLQFHHRGTERHRENTRGSVCLSPSFSLSFSLSFSPSLCTSVHLCASVVNLLLLSPTHPLICHLLLALAMGDGGLHEGQEQRVRLFGPALEFGVKLAAQHERVIRQLGNLHQTTIRRNP